MKFISFSVQGFRNFELLHTNIEELSHFIVGKNGQGKTNFLEALNLVTASRSFRTNSSQSLISWTNIQKEARLLFKVELDNGETETLEIQLKSGSKRILIDNEPVRVMKDFLGRYPTVALSSDDIQLLRGSPQLRRRFMDMAIASVNGEYFHVLRDYHKVLRERNSLLKKGKASSVLKAYDQTIEPLGNQLIKQRQEFFSWFSPVFKERYQLIGGEEKPEISYQPNFVPSENLSFADKLQKNLDRDLRFGSTSTGPHRDDFYFGLKEHEAKDYASEGQQRGLVLALRLAQILWFEHMTSGKPVILADDILGELDPQRRKGFWDSLGDQYQLFATGTTLPEKIDAREWCCWEMEEGVLKVEG